jgi:hypothetical protein
VRQVRTDTRVERTSARRRERWLGRSAASPTTQAYLRIDAFDCGTRPSPADQRVAAIGQLAGPRIPRDTGIMPSDPVRSRSLTSADRVDAAYESSWVAERLLIKQGDWSHARTSEVR